MSGRSPFPCAVDRGWTLLVHLLYYPLTLPTGTAHGLPIDKIVLYGGAAV